MFANPSDSIEWWIAFPCGSRTLGFSVTYTFAFIYCSKTNYRFCPFFLSKSTPCAIFPLTYSQSFCISSDSLKKEKIQQMQNQKSALGMDRNVTALIGYLVGIVAIILIFIEKDNKFVRFHALQSVLWVALTVVAIIIVAI